MMRQFGCLTILFFGTWLWSAPSLAALDLELTQGVSAALPVAILPFSGSKLSVPGSTTLSDVIKNDLQNSGQFRVLSSDTETPGSSVDYAYWRKQSVNALVKGSVRSLGGDRYEINVKLVDLFAGKKHHTGDSVLLNQTFTVPVQGSRQLAHHISDLVYQKLTGTPGIFSTKIAYVLVQRSTTKPPRYSLEISDADGFNSQALLTSDQPIMSPSWSPDARQLVYVSFEGHRAAIYLQNLKTGSRRVISKVPGINGAPAFSPDGQKLALVLTRTGNPKIYVLNLSSGKLNELTFGRSIDTEPSWSPNGRSLLFTSNRDGTPQIYQYTFSNRKVERLTYQGNYNARGSFLPGEDAIVMMHRDGGLFGIARQDLKGGRARMLIQTGLDESPSVAPNGKMIIYATQHNGQGVLAQVSSDGRIKLRLPAREGQVQEPAWSPFLGS